MAEVLVIAGLVLLLFFIFFVRPVRAEQGRRRKDLNALRIGDQVLTRGGLIATVVTVETPADGPMLLHLEVADGVVVKARTEAIAERLRAVDLPLPDGTDPADGPPDAQEDEISRRPP